MPGAARKKQGALCSRRGARGNAARYKARNDTIVCRFRPGPYRSQNGRAIIRERYHDRLMVQVADGAAIFGGIRVIVKNASERGCNHQESNERDGGRQIRNRRAFERHHRRLAKQHHIVDARWTKMAGAKSATRRFSRRSRTLKLPRRRKLCETGFSSLPVHSRSRLNAPCKSVPELFACSRYGRIPPITPWRKAFGESRAPNETAVEGEKTGSPASTLPLG